MDGHHDKFLRTISTHRPHRSARRRPAPLSAEEHAAHRERLQGVRFVKPKYAEDTQVNVAGICGKWKRYCNQNRVGEWRTTLETLRCETMMDFFLFVCGNYQIQSWGSSLEYIRQFQQLYTTVTGRYVDRNDAKELYKYHHEVLIPLFKLRPPNVDGKPVVSVEELRVLLVFNIAYDDRVYPGERHRIQNHGCYLFLSYTGARPAELVHSERKKPNDGTAAELFGSKVVMRTGDGDDLGLEGPNGEACNDTPPDEASRRVDELLLAETIGRGRPKALCYEDILLMMDDILLHAYEQINFLPYVKTWGSMKSTPLRWKFSKLKTPVFRRFDRDGQLSDTKAMQYSKLLYDMGQQSQDAGFEHRWTPRFFRRGAGNAANGNAPNEVRDQMMRHDPRFATFHGAYLNEKVQFDMQNTFLEEEKEEQLYRLLAHVSLTRDPRATRDMVPRKVWDKLPPDLEIQALEQRRAALKQGQYRIQGRDIEAEVLQLTNEIRTKKQQRDNRVVKQYREFYFHNRPTWDIERQARGEEEEAEYEQPPIELDIQERAQLAEIWCHQPEDWTDEDIARQRLRSIDLIRALCGKRETIKRRRTRKDQRAEVFVKQESPVPMAEPGPGAIRFPLLMDPNQCPDCLGDERLIDDQRHFRYCRPQVRNDHFDDHHLQEREVAERGGGLVVCKVRTCSEQKFRTVDEFRSHVQMVHGIKLRPSTLVESRRRKKAHQQKLAHRRQSP